MDRVNSVPSRFHTTLFDPCMNPCMRHVMNTMLCSPSGDAPSCRFSKPRCCAIPSAVDVDDDDDAIVLLAANADAADVAKPPKALVRTAHIISMVGIVNAWNFILM
jgi:hypothetical protein